MAKFSKRSLDKRATLHPKLQEIVDEAIKHFDFTITDGHRGEKEQNEAYAKGLSKLKFPNSKHNSKPSRAMDLAPYPIDYKDVERFVYLAGWIMAIAALKGIKLRSGLDWNRNTITRDEKFRDAPHFELDD